MKTLIAAVGLATVMVAPAFAQGPTPKIASGKVVGASSARSQVTPRHGRVVHQPRSHDTYGQRWPGATYDANGYYIDPNLPGRW